MDDDAFHAFLRGSPLTSGSAKSYRCYCHAVWRELAVDLDVADLSAEGIAALRARLEARAKAPGLKAHTVGKLMAGVQQYARFRKSQGVTKASTPMEPIPTFRSGGSKHAPDTEPARPDFIRDAKATQLVAWHGQIIDELGRRKIVRSRNGPLGDYAERLFATAFGWTLAAKSNRGFDAVDAAGQRIEIKARRRSHPRHVPQVGDLPGLLDRRFDVLAALIFEPDSSVARAILIPHEVVIGHASRTSRPEIWTLYLRATLWDLADTRDVTAEVTRAVEQLDNAMSASDPQNV
jgi:hypothetical protein